MVFRTENIRSENLAQNLKNSKMKTRARETVFCKTLLVFGVLLLSLELLGDKSLTPFGGQQTVG